MSHILFTLVSSASGHDSEWIITVFLIEQLFIIGNKIIHQSVSLGSYSESISQVSPIKLQMNSLKNRPPQLSSLLSRTSQHPSQQLQQYKKNMQIFIKQVQKDFSDAMNKYEQQIKGLIKQNRFLKEKLAKYESMQATSTHVVYNMNSGQQNSQRKRDPFTQQTNRKVVSELENLSEILTPIKIPNRRNRGLSDAQLLESTLLKNQLALNSLIDHESNLVSKVDKSSYQRSKQPSPLTKSKFEKSNSIKKQNQQNLMQSIQLGRTNLDFNTNKMFELIGMAQKQLNPEQITHQPKGSDGSSGIKRKVSFNDPMNSSLSSICDSLNNSFHGKKSREKNEKKKKKQKAQEEEKMKLMKHKEDFMKEQSIKNLLKTIRTNIDHAAQRPPQIIRSSKLMSTGSNKINSSEKRSKVLINPVPVDLHKKSTQNSPDKKNRSESPTKKPQSILKNSSSNILGRSLANISAISLYESGEQ